MNVVEGGGDVVSTEGGDVTLDLKALLGQTADRVGVGARRRGEACPTDAAQITIMESDNLELAQDAGAPAEGGRRLPRRALRWSCSRWRSTSPGAGGGEALRAAGFGLLIAGAAALVARTLAGDAVVDSLASTESVRPAAEATWSISTSLLVEAASAAHPLRDRGPIGAAWLAGPTSWATVARGGRSRPYLREPRIAYGALAVIVLILLAWGPTPALRRPLTAILLIGPAGARGSRR